LTGDKKHPKGAMASIARGRQKTSFFDGAARDFPAAKTDE
jgi:hypothetical protein